MRHAFSIWWLSLFAGLVLGAASPGHASLKGRVVDSAGKAVADAEVRVWQKVRAADGKRTDELVRFADAEYVRTDDNGLFQTSDELASGALARVVAEAPGLFAGRTAWILSSGVATDVGDIVLGRPRTVAGRIIDAAGHGIAAARVFSSGDTPDRAQATTDADGSFQLVGVADGRVFVFAEKPGFCFSGVTVNGEPTIQLTLAKNGNGAITAQRAPVARPMAEEPELLSKAERSQLASRLYEPYLSVVAEQGDDRDKYWALCEWSSVDPRDAFDRLGQWSFIDPQRREDARGNVLIQWMRHASAADWDEIRAVVESSNDPGWMAGSYLRGAVLMPTAEIDRRREWLTEAALHTGQIFDPSSRADMLAWLALRWQKIGDAPRAKAAREESRRIAEQLPPAEFDSAIVFGRLADAFAADDPEATLAWLDRMDHAGRFGYQAALIAARWAAERPAAAERLWRGAAERGTAAATARDLPLPQLCFQMAVVDLERAERLAGEASNLAWRTNARAAIAQAVSAHDPAAANAIVRRALNEFSLQEVCPPMSSDAPAECAAVAVARLLPVAAALDGDLAREVCWRAISLRCPRRPRTQLDDEHDLDDAALAQLITRYDRSLARSLLTPVTERLADFAGPAEYGSQKAMWIVNAAAVIDPRWAVELLDRLPPTPTADFRHSRNEARSRVVRVLALSDDERWTYAGFWKPN